MKKLIAIAALLMLAAGFYDSLYELVFPPEVIEESAEEEMPPEEEVAEAKQDDASAAAEPVATPAVPALLARLSPKVSAKPLEKPADVKLVIRDIQFDGVTAFSHDTLKNVVKEFIGQELSVQ